MATIRDRESQSKHTAWLGQFFHYFTKLHETVQKMLFTYMASYQNGVTHLFYIVSSDW